MKHPSFDIISNLVSTEFGPPDDALLLAFKDTVWSMRVFIPGERIDMPDGQVATHFSLSRGPAKGLPHLPLYAGESDAAKARGEDGYFAARFHFALRFAQSYRADTELMEGTDRLLIPHEKMLYLRDLAGTGEPDAGADDAERQRTAMLQFAARARGYCARHGDVRALHLATINTRGNCPMLVGALDAATYARHAHALLEISMDVFQPGWRFMLLDEASGHATLIRKVRQTPPCYLKITGQGWWDKCKSQFESPPLSLVRLQPG